MIHLNCGNLWDDDYLNTVIAWNQEFRRTIQVKALFGSVASLTPTARAADRLPYRDWAFLDKYVDKCNRHGIAVRYTLNQSCIGATQDFRFDWDNKLKDDVKELHNIGIHEWTVTSPLLIQLLKEMFPDDFIEVSTIAEVSTPEEARRWHSLGAEGVNISTSINRDFDAIRRLKDSDLIVSILANEACLYRCPWRRECYNLSSHNSLRAEELFGFYPFRRCTEVRLLHPEEWIMSRLVLPQWMKKYGDMTGVEWFKIAYRTHPKEVALPILRAYMEQKHTGNLLDLWPTISHLGGTSEPRDITYISSEELDELDVLGYFIGYGQRCEHEVCGVTCQYCKTIYEKASK